MSPWRTEVAVVVPTWNGADRLRPCLTSLAAQDHPLTVVVVENGSVDHSLEVLDELSAALPVPVVVLRNDRNLGFAGGVNVGIRWALEQGFEQIALFNNDAIADPGWLSELVAALREHPEVGAVTGRLLLGDRLSVDSTGDFYSVWALPFPRDRDRPATPVRPSGPVFAGSGGATLYRSSLFRAVGLFDEDFFAYFEDVDISFRAQLAGIGVRYVEGALAAHAQGSTSTSIRGFATKQVLQNMPLLMVKNVPASWLPAIGVRFLVLYPLLVLNAVRRGEWRAALRGPAAALRRMPRALRHRRHIQRTRVADLDLLRAMVWPTLPPGLVLARAVRNRLRALFGRTPLRDGTAEVDALGRPTGAGPTPPGSSTSR